VEITVSIYQHPFDRRAPVQVIMPMTGRTNNVDSAVTCITIGTGSMAINAAKTTPNHSDPSNIMSTTKAAVESQSHRHSEKICKDDSSRECWTMSVSSSSCHWLTTENRITAHNFMSAKHTPLPMSYSKPTNCTIPS
jgi:hypothetical protein